jgi:hypothetical protein
LGKFSVAEGSRYAMMDHINRLHQQDQDQDRDWDHAKEEDGASEIVNEPASSYYYDDSTNYETYRDDDEQSEHSEVDEERE